MAISVDKLAAELANTLSAYTGEIAEEVKEAVDTTAQELLDNIRADAPKRTGKYKKAMAVKTVSENTYERKKLWYVKSPHYRLQHPQRACNRHFGIPVLPEQNDIEKEECAFHSSLCGTSCQSKKNHAAPGAFVHVKNRSVEALQFPELLAEIHQAACKNQKVKGDYQK